MPLVFWRRLREQPFLLCEILAASLLIALLNLAFPLFSIQLFNRYLGHGHDGTLVTLAGGVLIALFFLHGLLLVRGRFLTVMCRAADPAGGDRAMDALLHAPSISLDQIPAHLRETAPESLAQLETASSPATMAPLFDFPFSLVYLGAVSLLHPLLGGISLFFITCGVVSGIMGAAAISRHGERLQPAEHARRSIFHQSAAGAETIRLFNGQQFVRQKWQQAAEHLVRGRTACDRSRDTSRAQQTSLAMGLYIFLYAMGGVLVVDGKLSVGALIGANILASRAFRTTSQFASSCFHLLRAGNASRKLAPLLNLPRETGTGTAIRSFSGRVACVGLSFHFPRCPTPLFEQLHLEILPGTILLVTGGNGSGKTTLARLMAGMLPPVRGEIRADGVSLSQIALPWWRQQLVYLPQEPHFLDGTIRDNILLNRPDLPEEELRRIVERCNLRPFLDQTPKGIMTPVRFGGHTLSPGIRKRIALARGLTTGGRLAIFDEPFEGIDADGHAALEKIIRDLAANGHAIMLSASSATGLSGVTMLLDMNSKPTPRLFRTDGGGDLFRYAP